MHRLFVALRPPRAIREQLRATMAHIPEARWQEDAQLHLTVRYIGEVERPVAEDVASILAGIAAPAVTASLAGTGRFDRRGRTDALWAGVTPHDALAALHRKVDRALVRCGLEPERRAYLPHITLARFSRTASAEFGIAQWLAHHAAVTSASFALDHLILYQSHLDRSGADYQAVARWPLG